jgi:hypothetical protein
VDDEKEKAWTLANRESVVVSYLTSSRTGMYLRKPQLSTIVTNLPANGGRSKATVWFEFFCKVDKRVDGENEGIKEEEDDEDEEEEEEEEEDDDEDDEIEDENKEVEEEKATV